MAHLAPVASRPRWDKLPDTLHLSPHWYEVEKTRGVASKVLGLIGGLCLAAAGFSKFTSIKRAPSFLFLIGIAVASFGIAWRFLTPSLNDPVVALRLRQKVGRDIQESPDMPFVIFFIKYQGLIEKGILQNSDIIPLVEHDIEQLDYAVFMTKHTEGEARTKEALIKVLSNEPIVALLRQKVGRDMKDSPDMSFETFFQKYPELIEEGILKNPDILPLLERDIEQLDYAAFMKKHAGGDARSKKALMKILSNEPILGVLRQKVGRDLKDSPDMPFVTFFKKYPELIEEGILKNADILPLLARDIEQLDDAAFMKKHGGGDYRCGTALLKVLPLDARRKMIAKSNQKSNIRSGVRWTLDVARHNDKTKELLDPNLVVLRATKLMDIGSVVWEKLDCITDPRAQEAFKTLYIEAVIEGRNFRLSKISKEVEQSIKGTVTVLELELFAEGRLPFNKLSCNSTWEEIALHLPKVNPSKMEKLKEQLRRVYLALLTTEELRDKSRIEMCQVLAITPQMIKDAQAPIAQECMTLDYLGEKGFRAKYGRKRLRDGTLKTEQIDKIKAELRLKLPNAYSEILNGVLEDLADLDLRSEILDQRWKNMSFSDIIAKEGELSIFLRHCNEVWKLDDVKAKIIEGIQGFTILQIAARFPEFFPKYLQPTDIFRNGKTFAEIAEEAVKEIGLNTTVNSSSFGKLFTLLQTGLLSYDNSSFLNIVKSFFTKNGQALLEYDPEKDFGTTTMDSLNKLIEIFKEKVSLQEVYQSAKSNVQQAKEARAVAKVELMERKNKLSEDEMKRRKALKEEYEAESEVRLSPSKENEQVSPYIKLFWENEKLKGDYQSDEAELSAFHQRVLGLPLLKEALQKQRDNLEKQAVPDLDSLTRLEAQLQKMRSEFLVLEENNKQFFQKDAGRIALQTEKERTKQAWMQQDTEELLYSLEKQKKGLEKYINDHPRTKALDKARQTLQELEKKRLEILKELEIWRAGDEKIAILNGRIDKIDQEIETCLSNIPIIELKITNNKAKLANLKNQLKALAPAEVKPQQPISTPQKRGVEGLSPLQEIEKEQKRLDNAYNDLVQSNIQLFINAVFTALRVKA